MIGTFNETDWGVILREARCDCSKSALKVHVQSRYLFSCQILLECSLHCIALYRHKVPEVTSALVSPNRLVSEPPELVIDAEDSRRNVREEAPARDALAPRRCVNSTMSMQPSLPSRSSLYSTVTR